MTESTSPDVCRQAAVDLIAARQVGVIATPLAGPFRHFLRLHGLSGLATVAMDAGRLDLPAGIATRVRSDWDAARHWSRALDAECIQIERNAAAYDVGRELSPPILLKGPSVASRYRDPSLRNYVDIDLLVPPEEVRPWAELLGSFGYCAPSPEVKATELRYQEGVALVRAAAAGNLSVDLHACLFIDRRAREFTYRDLMHHCAPGPVAGLLRPNPDLQILVLALHLAHHARDAQRLIWLHDLLELGTPAVAEAARHLASTLGLAWAVDLAFATVERTTGEVRWNATMPRLAPGGLAHAHQQGRTHYLRHLAMAHELGPLAAIRYALSRITPTRFLGKTGRFDWRRAKAWLRIVLIRLRSTPWLRRWS